MPSQRDNLKRFVGGTTSTNGGSAPPASGGVGLAPFDPQAGESVAVAFPKALIDRFRSDQPGKIPREGYVAEAVEIAAYSLLEQLALRCRDQATAEVHSGRALLLTPDSAPVLLQQRLQQPAGVRHW